MSFTLKLKEESVEIDGKTYVLRELDGWGRSAFMVKAAARLKGAEARPSAEAVMVSSSLLDPLLKVQAFTAEMVDAWPGQVVAALSDKVCAMSGLGGGTEGNG